MKTLPNLVLLIAGLLFACTTVQAREAHEGRVVKAGGGKLTIVDNEGKNEQSFEVASDAVISLDGEGCKLDDLPRDSWVTITTQQKGEKSYATKIEAKKSKNP